MVKHNYNYILYFIVPPRDPAENDAYGRNCDLGVQQYQYIVISSSCLSLLCATIIICHIIYVYL